MGGLINWERVRHDYETTNLSMRDLAMLHGSTYETIRRRAQRERWRRSEPSTEDARARQALKDHCEMHGCQSFSAATCSRCGFNLRESGLRRVRGLSRDPETGLWRMTKAAEED